MSLKFRLKIFPATYFWATSHLSSYGFAGILTALGAGKLLG